jgi:hypothetical protein
VLDHALGFTGTIAGFFEDVSNNSDKLDLQDINFASVNWTFKENSGGTGGTLSMADGTHTANIALIGHISPPTGPRRREVQTCSRPQTIAAPARWSRRPITRPETARST